MANFEVHFRVSIKMVDDRSRLPKISVVQKALKDNEGLKFAIQSALASGGIGWGYEDLEKTVTICCTEVRRDTYDPTKAR